jgi:DNA-binding beta-propeller fold protein YncE
MNARAASRVLFCCLWSCISACSGGAAPDVDAATPTDATASDTSSIDAGPSTPHLPLVLVADVPLPGSAVRFDYQEIDPMRGQLVVAHMNYNSVLILSVADGSVLRELTNIPTPRGVAIASDIGRIFVTSTPGHLVLIDATTLMETSRVVVGSAPDGCGWDPHDQIAATSDQSQGAISLLTMGGTGTRTQVPLGVETGNVVYDASRGVFWITVVTAAPPDQLVAVDPVGATATMRIDLPGCDGAHGLRLHPDGQSAFIACENNSMLARVDLGGAHAVTIAATGAGPDVLSIDATIGWLYVSAESGDLTVFDINQPGVALIGHDSPGAASHTVAADPATHRVFFPLQSGPSGTPVLRIMRPSGV